MTNWNLIRRFLDFDILETNEFACFHLENKLSFDLILNAFHTWALNKRSELLLLNNLVDFKTASITCIVSNLDARFDVTASCNNTLNDNKRTNCISFDLSHSHTIFLCTLTRSNAQMICSFQFWRNAKFLWSSILCLIRSNKTLSLHGLLCIYRIKSSLSHLDII